MNYFLLEPLPLPQQLQTSCIATSAMACRQATTSFCTDSCQILQWEQDAPAGSTVTVCRPYCAICYDTACCCYWCISTDRMHLYQLSLDFCELQCVDLCALVCKYGKIADLDCCADGSLVLCFSSVLVALAKVPPYQSTLVLEVPESFFRSLAICEDIFVVAEQLGNIDRLTGYAQCCGEILFQCALPPGCRCRAICGVPCCGEIRVLTYCYKNQLQIFRGTRPRCDQPLCTGNPPPPPRCGSCSIIQSVALEQAALSHILNAEGEKIQRAVCLSTNICDLLKVNASVNETISRVIELEQVLLKKLTLVEAHDQWMAEPYDSGCKKPLG